MKTSSLTARLGLAALVLGAASGLALAQAPSDQAAVPPSSASSPADNPGPKAGAQRFHHGRKWSPAQEKRLDQLASTYGLSDLQKGQLKELMILHRQKTAKRRAAEGRREHGREALNRREFRREFRAILTPEQFARLRSDRAARRQALAAPASQAAAPAPAPAAP